MTLQISKWKIKLSAALFILVKCWEVVGCHCFPQLPGPLNPTPSMQGEGWVGERNTQEVSQQSSCFSGQESQLSLLQHRPRDRRRIRKGELTWGRREAAGLRILLWHIICGSWNQAGEWPESEPERTSGIILFQISHIPTEETESQRGKGRGPNVKGASV